jgi:hypothetical protein
MSSDYPEYTGEVVAEIRGVELCRDQFGAYFWNGGQRPTGVFALKNYQRDPGRSPRWDYRTLDCRHRVRTGEVYVNFYLEHQDVCVACAETFDARPED